MRTSFSLFPALLSLASAFIDTSPYFLIHSPSPILTSKFQPSIITSTTKYDSLINSLLARCESPAYLVVSQSAFHASDLAHAPQLRKLVESVPRGHVVSTQNVYVEDNTHGMNYIAEGAIRTAEEKCGATVEEAGALGRMGDERPKVVRVEFEKLPVEEADRRKVVEQNDKFLKAAVDVLGTEKWTLVYVSSPISGAGEEPVEVADAGELRKREEDRKNETKVEGGLFHRYQFFTPAILTGYLTMIFLIFVLYVGLSAIGGLKVSYGSFDKEMGPAAQKKQQ